MSQSPIYSLCRPGGIPDEAGTPILIETHISWVLMGDRSVYKFKKPLRYSFLDFSTLEKRRFYCRRELELNRRLTEDIYLGVVPVRQEARRWRLEAWREEDEGEMPTENGASDGRSGAENAWGSIVEYAVWMRKMEPSRRMDLLAREDKIREAEIDALAELLGRWHRGAEIVREGDARGEAETMRHLFNDLAREREVLVPLLGAWAGEVIDRALSFSDQFLGTHGTLMEGRRAAGLYRDGHGDLHCRNIFLLERPQVFDCIEFNDGLRQVDVLNDIAFLCMDLDTLGCGGLAERFFDRYCREFPEAMGGSAAKRRSEKMRREVLHLLEYYKAYRANIRAKINSLRVRSAATGEQRQKAQAAAAEYLRQMDAYLMADRSQRVG
jgi:aminoglycoside phosphotransferase family enzyme